MRFPLFIFTVHCPTLCLFCFHLYLDLIILLKGEVKRQGPKWQGRAIAVLFEEFSLLVPLMAIQCIRMFWIIAFVWSKAHFYSQAQIEYHWRLWRKHDRDLDLMDVKHEGHSPLESSLASLIGGGSSCVSAAPSILTASRTLCPFWPWRWNVFLCKTAALKCSSR